MKDKILIAFTGTTGSGKSTTGIETVMKVAHRLNKRIEPIDEYQILRDGWAMENRGITNKVEWIRPSGRLSEYFVIKDAAYQEAFLAVASAIAMRILNSDADGWVTEAARNIGIPLAGYYSHFYEPLVKKLPTNIKFANIAMEVGTLSDQVRRVDYRLSKNPDAAPVEVLEKYLQFEKEGESSVEAARRLGSRVLCNESFDNSGPQDEAINRIQGIISQILAGGVPV